MKRMASLCPLLALLFVLCGGVVAGAATPAPPTALLNTDCVKCHAQPPADIEANGLSHKTAVSCQDCHVGHPPTTRNIIPQCSQCHEGQAHFQLKNCLECHRNPHTPKVITYGKDVTDPCLTCHDSQIKQLRENPSKHSKLFCSSCHDQHGKIPNCTQCHKPHAAEMTGSDCKKCHRAHMPKTVTYANDQVKNADCGACHKQAFALLTASTYKHGTKNCTFCHVDKHKAVPTCQTCHGTPHPQALLTKFGSCGACHSIAHDLYKFAPAAKKGAETRAQ